MMSRISEIFFVEKCGYVEEDSKYELMRRIGNVDPPYLNEWMSKKTSEWVCEAVSDRFNKREIKKEKWLSEWFWEWVSECVGDLVN